VATLIDRLAQVAYEAYRAALPTSVLAWEDLTKQERQAWKAAVTAVAGQTGGTLAEPPPGRSLVIQMGDQRHTFRTDFTVGREGRLEIDDDFASGQHARFLTVRGLWYVEDLDSTNGTTHNGRPILSAQLLRKKDKIKIGQTVMTVVSVLAVAEMSHPGPVRNNALYSSERAVATPTRCSRFFPGGSAGSPARAGQGRVPIRLAIALAGCSPAAAPPNADPGAPVSTASAPGATALPPHVYRTCCAGNRRPPLA
jgi:pSer/pThr/pTyr-binding forkhead associated (FHA) protein